jgi:spermidine synthase
MTNSTADRRTIALVSLLFFLSGATALTAEVVLNKLLTYVFGSSHLSTSTVLAAYMAGLSAGAWLFGRRAHERTQPVLAYAGLEFAVGIFYALLPLIFGPFQRLGISLASPLANAPVALTIVRFVLSFLLVFAPTLMMGGTLPTLVAAFRRGQALQKNLPLLYAVNTLGAAVGTLAASYAVIPRIGLDGTLYACAGVNFVIAVVSAIIAKRMGPVVRADEEPKEEKAAEATKPTATWYLPPRLALGLAFAQGTLAFVLEVVWFHLIGTVIGVTTYAFALMLFAILLGIGLGSLILPIVARKTRLSSASIFVWAMMLAALGVALSLNGWDDFSLFIDKTYKLREPGHFFAREGVRLAYCLVLLLPTTLALGMSLPALAAGTREQDGRHGAWVGRLFASNTLGTIVGSLVCGFVLLGRFGSEKILSFGVVLALGLALLAFVSGLKSKDDKKPSRRERGAFGITAGICLALLFSFSGWDVYRLTLGSHYYWEPPETNHDSEVDWLREDAQSGFITVMRAKSNGKRTMRTNGKYEGNSEPGEFQDLFALLGGLYVKHYDRAVLVGIGPSRTLAVLHAMPFKKIEAIEYSPAILEAAKTQFPEFSKEAFEDTSRVTIVCDDGRNHLQLAREPYDYVAIAISGAAFAGAGNIYSRDFFRAVSDKLRPDGIFMLWIQVHHVFPRDVRSVVHTLRSVFPNVHFYTDPFQSQGFLLASRAPLTIDPDLVKSLDDSPRVRTALRAHNLSTALDLVERSVFTTDAEFERYLAGLEKNEQLVLLTDLFPAFEYSTPYGLAEQLTSYYFHGYSDHLLPAISPAVTPEEYARLESRRALAWGNKVKGLEALRRAKELGGHDLYDDVIRKLELETRR